MGDQNWMRDCGKEICVLLRNAKSPQNNCTAKSPPNLLASRFGFKISSNFNISLSTLKSEFVLLLLNLIAIRKSSKTKNTFVALPSSILNDKKIGTVGGLVSCPTYAADPEHQNKKTASLQTNFPSVLSGLP